MSRLEFTPDQIDARIKTDKEMQVLAQDDPTEFEAQHAQMYRSFGYKPDGSPLGKVQKAFSATSRATGIPEGVVKGVASAVIPTALTIAGGATGTMAGGVGAPLGMAAGAVAGEFANYAAGITEEPPTPLDLGVSAGASLLGPLASRAKAGFPSLVQRLPGAGMAMHPLATEILEKQIKHMRIDKTDVDMLRGLLDKVPDFKAEIPMVRGVLKNELDLAARSQKPDKAYIKELDALTANLSNKKQLSFKELMATEKDLITSGSEDSRAVWSKLSGVLIQDLETQAKNPKLTQATRDKIAEGVQQFKMYSAFNKRYQANATLDQVLNRSFTQVEGADDMVRFNKQQFIKEMDRNKTLQAVFEPSEIADMRKAITDLGYLAAPPGGGANKAGSSIHAGVGGALGMAGYAMGGYMGMLVAGLGAAELIRVGLSTQSGRNGIKYLATQGKGRINVLELDQMLGKIIGGMSTGGVAGIKGSSSPTGVNAFPNEE